MAVDFILEIGCEGIFENKLIIINTEEPGSKFYGNINDTIIAKFINEDGYCENNIESAFEVL